MMKITNGITGGLLLGGGYLSYFTVEKVTAVIGLIAIVTALIVNIIAHFRRKASTKLEDNKNIAEEKVAQLEVKLLEKQIKKLDEE